MLALDEVGEMTQKNITHIGNVPIQTIMNMCDLYFPAENDGARARNYSQNALNAQILQYAGCKIDGDTVEITFETQGTMTTEKVGFIAKDPSQICNDTTEMSSELIGDVLYIDVNAFNDNKALDEQFEILKSAVKNGINKVIIDVRNNPGGKLYNHGKILVAMDML